MKCYSIVLLATLSFGLSVASSMSTDETVGEHRPETTGVQPSGRANFVMQKLFDFEEFRDKFNKHYTNAAEIARRTKLFMARAFAVFISGIKYMYHKGTKFLKINSRSDWTQKERQASMNRRVGRLAATVVGEADNRETPVPAVDLEDVKQVMAEINERKHEDSDHARELELEQAERNNINDQHQCERPNADSSGTSDDSFPEPQQRHHLFMDDLMGGSDLNAPQHEDENSTQQQKMMSQKRGHKMPRTEHESESDDSAEKERPKDQMFLDYRSDKCFLPPKKQGKCGSCYIFATTALVEYHHCMQTGDLVPFSEQYVIDCGHNRTNGEFIYGCDGGLERSVGRFFSKFGIELSVDYPYKATNQICPYPKEIEAKHMGHTKMGQTEIFQYGDNNRDGHPSKDTIELLLRNRGPLFTLIIPSDDFDDFGGGVDVLNCNLDSEIGHSMVIIGHGIEDGIEYWLIRNSYGVDFGVEGHYKLAKSSKEGCITRIGYVKGQFINNTSHRREYLHDKLRDNNGSDQIIHPLMS